MWITYSRSESRGASFEWGPVNCSDGEYFSRRAQEERQAAIDATNQTAKRTHVDLAEAYERRARALAAEKCRSDIRIVIGN